MLSRPVVAVLTTTLGLPLLILCALASLPGVNANAFTSLLTMIVLSTFLTLMIFEIKRVANQAP